jgi:hypothetical protein
VNTLNDLLTTGASQVIFSCIAGSRAYGTQIPGSDEDIRGLYVVRAARHTALCDRDSGAGLAQAPAVTGDKPAMERILKELGESADRYVSPYNVARVYAAIDEKQRALEWLERAYREHNPDLIEPTREPSFAGLRSDTKFRELVERIGWRGMAAD